LTLFGAASLLGMVAGTLAMRMLAPKLGPARLVGLGTTLALSGTSTLALALAPRVLVTAATAFLAGHALVPVRDILPG
jgi:hypothetical protein